MAERVAPKVRDVVLIIIDRCANQSEFGRTSLQKVSYLSSVRFGLDTGHSAHYYGPFSHEIEREIEALTLSGLVEEKSMGLGFANRAGFEARKYEYDVTPTGKARVAELEATYTRQI